MDGTPGTLRIETGENTATTQATPKPLQAWVAPTLAGGVVFAGLMVAALGVLWLRRRPLHEPTQDELFEQVAKALGLTPAQRAEALSKAGDGITATGRAMWGS